MHTRTTIGEHNLGDLRTLATVPAQGLDSWRSRTSLRNHPEHTKKSPTGEGHQRSRDFLSEPEARLLRAVRDHPAQPSSMYPRLAGVSPRRAVEMRARLVESGHLREHRVNRAGRGRDAVMLALTETGRSALQGAGGPGGVA